MNIRECAWCRKAIYGDDYRIGTGGYYHKDCQIPDGAGRNDTPSYVERGTGGGGGSGEVIVMPSGDFACLEIESLKAENARLKELNREMVEGLNEIKEVTFSMDMQDSNMIHRVIDATIAKAEGRGEGE